jgi:hypothetical protein
MLPRCTEPQTSNLASSLHNYIPYLLQHTFIGRTSGPDPTRQLRIIYFCFPSGTHVVSPHCHLSLLMPAPLLRWLVACLTPLRYRFGPRLVHVSFVVDKMILEQVLFRVFSFSPVIIILTMLRPHIWFIYHRRCIIFATDSLLQDLNILLASK